MSVKINSTNEGHRHRLRQRFIKQGLEGFEDHNVLELLLFYALPYKDTNKLAHDIMNRFNNNIEDVFNADIDELCSVNGVGENVATLIKLVPAISNYYYKLKHKDKESFLDVDDIAEFLKGQYLFDEVETFSLISLDSAGKFLGFDKLDSGTANMTEVSFFSLIEAAIKRKAACVVIAHNHPGGSLKPSVNDISSTRRICDVLNSMNIHVLDHIIITPNNGYLSIINSSQYGSIFK